MESQIEKVNGGFSESFALIELELELVLGL
jgi:hypothetical protein